MAEVGSDFSAVLPQLGSFFVAEYIWALLAHQCDTCWRRGDALGQQQCSLYVRALLLQIWEEVLHPAPSAVDLAITGIVRQIQMEPGKHWSVDELAQQAHLSHAQFGRRFRAATGLSPMRFIVQVRLDRARQLVQETSMTLGQIAAVLGYDDLSFFSRQYKAYAGYAPSSLRRRPTVDI